MDLVLHITSTWRGYNLYLSEKSEGVNFFRHHTFSTYVDRLNELQNSSLEDTSLLIEYAQKNGIDSLEVETRGPLGCSPLNMELLATYGINITCIKDKTPIPHNGYRPQRRTRKVTIN